MGPADDLSNGQDDTFGNRVADLEIGQTRGLCDEPKFRIDGTQ